MPKPINIEYFRIAETKVNEAEVTRWLTHLGAAEYTAEVQQLLAEDGAVSQPALLIALAAKRCYMSFEPGLNPNVTRVRKEFSDYFDNILKSGHGSVLEHSVFTYALEGVSRVFTAEMNRHRAGWAISEGSLRFIRFDKDIPFWMPTSLQDDPGDDADLRRRKEMSRLVFFQAFADQEGHYKRLLDIWDMEEGSHNFAYKKKVTSCLRRIIGMGVATGGVWSGNIRALRHVLTMRCSPVAEEEILHVFSRIAKDLASQQPLLFGDFHLNDDGFWVPTYLKV